MLFHFNELQAPETGMGISDPGPGGGYTKGPGGGMGMYDPNPGGGYLKDPGTGI
ncbi:TPA: hypothetical protein QCY10_000077 [Bacillus mobilis]|nr:hypothetical protein [Bacillus mobilis]